MLITRLSHGSIFARSKMQSFRFSIQTGAFHHFVSGQLHPYPHLPCSDTTTFSFDPTAHSSVDSAFCCRSVTQSEVSSFRCSQCHHNPSVVSEPSSRHYFLVNMDTVAQSIEQVLLEQLFAEQPEVSTSLFCSPILLGR